MGAWFGVAPKMEIKNTCLKETGLRVGNVSTILGLIVNMIIGGNYVNV